MYPTLGQIFEQTVTRYPHREGMVYPQKNQRWTFKEWDEKINKLSNAFLNAGLKKGDVVSTFLYNTSEFVTTCLACIKTGILFNPINFRLAGEELAFILNDSRSRALIFEEALIPQVNTARERTNIKLFLYADDQGMPSYARGFYDFMETGGGERPEADLTENDRYIIMYTSGTTGKPKGVIHRHRDMIEQNYALIAYLRLTPYDRGLSAAPLNHAAELHCVFLPRIHMGATSVLIHHFEPKAVLQHLQDEKITAMFAAPTMWNMLLQEDLAKYDLSSFRKILYGGAAMAPAMVKRCHEAFHADLVQAYGMTEMGPAVTILLPEEQLPKAGSAGKAILNHEVRVVRPREDGYIWIADRLDDMIVSGGENIYPREVEDVLYEHPDILEVAVVGLPDEKWGKVVTAFVVPKREGLTAGELDRYLLDGQKLAAFKRPRLYKFVEKLPKTASGKIQKFMLQASYA